MDFDLKEKSFHANFYKKSYGFFPSEELPESICPYTWKLLWAILWLPLTWWSYLFQSIKYLNISNSAYYLWQRKLTGFFSYAFSGLLMFMIAAAIKHPDQFVKLLSLLSITLLVIGVIVIIVIIARIFFKVIPHLGKKVAEKDGYKIISGTIYSIKNKVCPRINWIKK